MSNIENTKTFTVYDAAEYVQTWGSLEAIKATVEMGVADDDRDCLADAGFDPDQAAEVLLAYCRERAVGQRVEAGEGEDHDTGIVERVEGSMAYVSWDSGVKTPCPVSDLRII